jgi:hypothetical protein
MYVVYLHPLIVLCIFFYRHPHAFVVESLQLQRKERSSLLPDTCPTWQLDKYFYPTPLQPWGVSRAHAIESANAAHPRPRKFAQTTRSLPESLSTSLYEAFLCRMANKKVQPYISCLWFRNDSTFPRGTLPPIGILYFVQRCLKKPGGRLHIDVLIATRTMTKLSRRDERTETDGAIDPNNGARRAFEMLMSAQLFI